MVYHFLILLLVTTCSQLCLKKKKSPFSTCRFYSCVEGHEPVVLIIKTLDEEVIIINLTIVGTYYLIFYLAL